MKTRSFQQRYIFTGHLTLKTGLHVGSGWAVGSPSDNPVVRTPDGRPFIPGSSFKGAFRSTVEKLADAAGLSSCMLQEGQGCVGAQGEEQRQFDKERNNKRWSGETLLAQLTNNLCDTCKLFGSPYRASRIIFADLLPPQDDDLASKMIQIRDGVAIDRDSEKAVDRLKYDFEVVAPSQVFDLNIMLEDPTATDISLTCLGLSEFVSGVGYVGGKRSRGLGNCQIEDLHIYCLDLTEEDVATRAKRLRKYLLGKTLVDKMDHIVDVHRFLDQQIGMLPIFKEGSHA